MAVHYRCKNIYEILHGSSISGLDENWILKRANRVLKEVLKRKKGVLVHRFNSISC
jgi:hypothetical protein